MEETISYETFFSTEEWDAIEADTYYDVMAEEAELEFGSVSPHGEEAEEQHAVSIYEQGNGFEIECELCGPIGEANSQGEADFDQASTRVLRSEAGIRTPVHKRTTARFGDPQHGWTRDVTDQPVAQTAPVSPIFGSSLGRSINPLCLVARLAGRLIHLSP